LFDPFLGAGSPTPGSWWPTTAAITAYSDIMDRGGGESREGRGVPGHPACAGCCSASAIARHRLRRCCSCGLFARFPRAAGGRDRKPARNWVSPLFRVAEEVLRAAPHGPGPRIRATPSGGTSGSPRSTRTTLARAEGADRPGADSWLGLRLGPHTEGIAEPLAFRPRTWRRRALHRRRDPARRATTTPPPLRCGRRLTSRAPEPRACGPPRQLRAGRVSLRAAGSSCCS